MRLMRTESIMEDKRNHPFDEVAANMRRQMENGWTVQQKFTCEHCNLRQTVSDTNTVYALGACHKCGHVTDLKRTGCNFAAARVI